MAFREVALYILKRLEAICEGAIDVVHANRLFCRISDFYFA